MTVEFKDLKCEYLKLYCTMEINKIEEINKVVSFIRQNKDKYVEVSSQFNGSIPWWFISLIHYRESSLSFNTHLHNGDSLQFRTKNVPSGRPKTGNPPFTWGSSAVDALTLKGFHKESDFSIPRVLFNLEKYNGFGYRLYHKETLSPYLWSFTNHYIKGGYKSDGKWSKTYVSKQIGCAPLLKVLLEE